MSVPVEIVPRSPAVRERSVKILAKSIYRQLEESGYTSGEMVTFTSELLDLLIRSKKPAPSRDSGT